jgi:thiamine pyrophosphate-dependent acetolactate synthase large subunit-like protein
VPVPPRHPNYRGILPASIPAVASHLDGHDLIVAFGAPIFMYHEFEDGDYLPAGAELWAVTSDPDEAARAPVGHILIGDPAEAVTRLADSIPAAGRPPISGLWTAAQHNIPVVFVVARNSEYRALKEFSRFMHAPDAPGMELPGMDIPGIAAAYGVQADRVKSLSDLTHAVQGALSSDKPHLIEIDERRIDDES